MSRQKSSEMTVSLSPQFMFYFYSSHLYIGIHYITLALAVVVTIKALMTLTRPNPSLTNGCHCPRGMVIRMRTVIATKPIGNKLARERGLVPTRPLVRLFLAFRLFSFRFCLVKCKEPKEECNGQFR